MMFLNDAQYNWSTIENEVGSISFKGDKFVALEIAKMITSTESKDVKSLVEGILRTQNSFTSGVIETQDYIVAWVDHIRSWPVFYTSRNSKITVSNNPRRIVENRGLSVISEESVREFSMAGYVTGDKTLYSDLNTLSAGEFLIWDKKIGHLSKVKYFTYTPLYSEVDNMDQKIIELDDILNEITVEIIEKARGKTVWVPLSAGLDSRIILCKLHEHGCPNIQTFTYGPQFNCEAIHAKRIAKALNVPWRMIKIPPKALRTLFESDTRKKFWRFSDNLKNIPCMREFSAISYLYENNIAHKGDVFINGQSGDYITGGHIPDICFKKNTVEVGKLTQKLIDKHYDLWKSLKTNKNLSDIKKRISAVMPVGWENNTSSADRAGQAETWEYEARQICYVVNGQRAYEFFGFDWEMPLWDKRIVSLCQNLSLREKENQFLYRSYLKKYNYQGLFPQQEPHLWRWPLSRMWVVVVAQLIGTVFGRKAKDSFYGRQRYYGHYANQYAFFSKKYHYSTYNRARNIVSLYVPQWNKENSNISSSQRF